jgi:uncharacterized membrane protein required for colicin V production
MTVVDLVIIGVVAFLALIGLRSGLLRPISGIGGLIIGVILAMQHNSEVALMLADYIEGELPRRVPPSEASLSPQRQWQGWSLGW